MKAIDGSGDTRHGARSAPLRVYCYPYSGGSDTVFESWDLGDAFELTPLFLPGRGRRRHEPPCASVAGLVAATIDQIRPDEPFVLLGYSLGALVAFETARDLRRRGSDPPRGLAVLAHRAPHAPPPMCSTVVSDLSRESRVEVMSTGNPTDAPHRSFTFRVPRGPDDARRCDFDAAREYVFEPKAPLELPLLALGGDGDPIALPAEVEAWRLHTRSSFQYASLPGGHLFGWANPRECMLPLSQWLASLA